MSTMRQATRYAFASNGQLFRDGVPLNVDLDGVLLDAQFELADGSALIWLTDDSPYDEGLHVYLLAPDGRVADGLEAGGTFAPGVLKIRASGDDWVSFNFFNNDHGYRLSVGRKASVRRPLPAGWRYKSLLSRHRLSVVAADEGA